MQKAYTTSSLAASLGASDTARDILAHDWSTSPLGPMEGWPQWLESAAALVLRSPAPMALLVGAQGALLYNDGYRQIVGDKHPGAMGRPATVVWPEAAQFNSDVIARVLDGESLSFRGAQFALEREGVLRDCWFDLDYSPIFDGHGQPSGVLAIVIEQTALVQATAQVERERQQFVELFQQAPTFMAVLRGPQHVFERMNPGYAKLIGYRDVLGQTVAAALPEAADQGFVALLDTVYQSGQPYTGIGQRFAIAHEPGAALAERFVDFVYQPIRDANGVVTSIFVEGADVTERELAAAAKRASDARNRQILDSAVDYAIMAFDLEGRITRWNEGARRIFGWREADMLGSDGACFYTPEDQAAGRMRTDMQAALDGRAGTDERWHVRQSGQRFWAAAEMTPLRDEDGQPIGCVKVLRDCSERHLAAEALRESQQRLDHAQSAGGVGTFTLELASGTIFTTSGFNRLFGLPDEPYVDIGVVEALVIPEDQQLRSNRLSRANQSTALDTEYRIRRANDGALRWILRRARFERNAAGQTDRMIGVVQDITERKAAELALAESAAQFLTLTQALPNLVWTATAGGEVDWFNDRVFDYTGRSAAQLADGGWADVIAPEDVPEAARLWRNCVASGAFYETEYRIGRADGQYRWHLVRAFPQRGPNGRIKRWIGTSTDIDERKRADARNQRDLNRIWRLSQELMLVCDFQGVISAVNPSATRLLGWSEAELVGRSLGDFVHPDDLAATAAEVGKLANGVTTLAFENRYRCRDGSYRLLDWTAVPDGGLIHAVGRDVTRERAAEEALRQSQKLEAIGMLTGGVAHDFNNVLAVVRTSIDLLRLVPLNDERRQRYMDAISDAVTRASKLTGQLLAFARRQSLQPVVFDVGQNLQMVSDMVGSLTGARIRMQFVLPQERCYVDADPSQFDTAIVNLAVNARDAMDGSGRLTISMAPATMIPAVRGQNAVAGQFVAVSVADTGKGIAPELLTQIFEPFFTTKGSGHGTGLGLSQVFGFAKQSGGEIVVDSEVGQGTVFTLYLPRACPPSEERRLPAREPGLARGNGRTILAVEDNPELGLIVRQSLEELGYQTVLTTSAEAALVELEQNAQRFVAVFSDVVMDGMGGIELGKVVRARFPALPFVLSSGYSYVLARDPGHGFTLLPKPYALEDLARTLDEAISATTPAGQDRELFRLAELDGLQVLDTDTEAGFDQVTAMAAQFFDVPIALISLIDAERQWFKSRVGMDASETPRAHAFCAHAIQVPGEVMVIDDASKDARFAANPLVTGAPNIRFYAGAPLVTAAGHALGTLCVIDRQPRTLTAAQVEQLRRLAAKVVGQLEARRRVAGKMTP